MPLIRTEKLTKKYVAGGIDLRAIYDIDLEIETGEFLAITGPSGAGKSTLLHVLGCLDEPTSGNYFVEDINARLLSLPERAWLRNHKMGFVFQDSLLLGYLNATENVSLPLLYAGIQENEAENRARKLLTEVGLADRLTFYPRQLSGGQQQRIAIARALAMRPPILFADEPTGNLDSVNSQLIFDLFLQLNKNHRTTIILVTHELSLAKQTSRIVTIKDGKIISDQRAQESGR